MNKFFWTLITLFVFCFFLWRINSYFELFALNNVHNVERGDRVFRVMTYNINAITGNEEIESVKTSLLSEIIKYSPDILCLHEMSSSLYKSVHTSLDSIFGYNEGIKNKMPAQYLIYSKRPVRDYKRYPYVMHFDAKGSKTLKKYATKLRWGMPVYSAEIEVEPGRWLTFFSVHLRSSAYSTARRSMGMDKAWMKGLPMYFENYRDGQKIRNYEAENIRHHLEELEAEDRPILIAGDFNDWSGSCCMNIIRNSVYKDAWWEGGFGFGITYDGWHLKLRLDHILFNQHFRLENVNVENSKLSDHRPLIADFTLMD